MFFITFARFLVIISSNILYFVKNKNIEMKATII